MQTVAEFIHFFSVIIPSKIHDETTFARIRSFVNAMNVSGREPVPFSFRFVHLRFIVVHYL